MSDAKPVTVPDRTIPVGQVDWLQIRFTLRNVPDMVDFAGKRFSPQDGEVRLLGAQTRAVVWVTGPRYRVNGLLGVARGGVSYDLWRGPLDNNLHPSPPEWLREWLDDVGILGALSLSAVKIASQPTTLRSTTDA